MWGDMYILNTLHVSCYAMCRLYLRELSPNDLVQKYKVPKVPNTAVYVFIVQYQEMFIPTPWKVT